MSSPPQFVIVAPRYLTNSYGVQVMHRLCHTLNELGLSAVMMFNWKDESGRIQVGFQGPEWTHPQLKTPVLAPCDRRFFDNVIVVYPESIGGNPLGAPKVIRYFLNKECYFPGDPKVEVGPNDFLIAFHRMFRPDAHVVLTESNMNPVFNSAGTKPVNQRPLKLTYIGKGEYEGPTFIIKDSIYIARNWPTDQNQLAILMKNSRLVFSWDSMSGVPLEAVLCGAMPVYLRYGRFTKEEVDSTELGPIPRLDMDHQGFDFDEAAFLAGKARMEENMRRLHRTWKVRVNDCLTKALHHFAQRF